MGKGGDTVSIIPAGLPNITGTFQVWGRKNATGAFAFDGAPESYYNLNSTAEILESLDTFSLNANRSSSIYGASDTVQPPSLVLIPQIKF